MIFFTLGLLWRHCNIQVKFIAFVFTHFLNSAFHLLNKVAVKFRVEVITFVFVKTLDWLVVFAKVFPNNADDSFLHLLFKNMILSTGVDFIKEFFFPFLVSIVGLLLWHGSDGLMLEILRKHLKILPSESFHSDCYLFRKIVIRVLWERPFDKLFQGNNFIGSRLRLWRGDRSHWVWKSNAAVDVCLAIFKDRGRFSLVNVLLNTFRSRFLDGRGNGFEVDALDCFGGARGHKFF